MLVGFSSPAFADITHRMTSSVNLHTGAAYNTAERIGQRIPLLDLVSQWTLVVATLLMVLLVASVHSHQELVKDQLLQRPRHLLAGVQL